ncbi:MAG: ABC transporter substrate-binding protein [Clostridiales bacterium]|nr:ABC transporter substrate-binding protein [Clostridiales bacterium]
MKRLFAMLLVVAMLAGLGMAAQAESDKIIIGAITDLTGNGSVLGTGCANGWTFAVEKINAEGGILGKQVELVIYDCQSDPQEALSCYERLVKVDGASIVLGPPFSNIGLALADTVDELGVPFFGLFGDPRCMLGENLDTLHPYMFLGQPSGYDAGLISGSYPHEVLGLNKAAILVTQDHSYNMTMTKAFQDYAAKVGIEITTVQYCSVKDTDLTLQLTAIASSGAEYIFDACNTNALAVATQQMYQMGIDLVHCGSLDFSSPFNELVDPPEAMRNIYFPYAIDMNAESLTDITAEFTERFGVAPTVKSWNSYDLTTITKAAIEKAGSAEPAAIRDALETIEGVPCLATENFRMDPETHMPLGLAMCIYNLEGGEYSNMGSFFPAKW